jgi:7-carboxy-7-deazaguanine synthase
VAFSGLLITEIFHSLQGESSLIGIPFAFIRLTGCNLRCAYCDSVYAFKGGTKKSVEEVLETIRPYEVRHVLLTGGEPLLQRNTPELLQRLIAEGYEVSIETHGEVSIREVAPHARIVMDIKTPGSRMNRGGFRENLQYLKPSDEIKFVITSQSDYYWARDLMRETQLPTREILFSPALPAENSPAPYEGVQPRWLAERILEDKLPVRFQLQLHKQLWGMDTKGV